MRNGLRLGLALALLALAGGCKERKPVPKAGTEVPVDAAAAELERFQAEENARSRVTMIDAATGDAAAMPNDSSGPTAYDLAKTEGGTKDEQGSSEAAPADAAASGSAAPAAPAEVPAQEEFPSVAQPNAG